MSQCLSSLTLLAAARCGAGDAPSFLATLTRKTKKTLT